MRTWAKDSGGLSLGAVLDLLYCSIPKERAPCRIETAVYLLIGKICSPRKGITRSVKQPERDANRGVLRTQVV